jgi:hypothetical protein
MAISGVGNEYDVTLKAGASAQTSTSQYLCVGAGWTTTSTDWTALITNDSTTGGTINAHAFIGVNQTGAMSAGSESMKVRMFGISKVKCATSIQAWSWVECYNGISTTTFRGHIQQLVAGETFTAMTTSAWRVPVGRALESGSTNSVISVVIIPSLYEGNLIEH